MPRFRNQTSRLLPVNIDENNSRLIPAHGNITLLEEELTAPEVQGHIRAQRLVRLPDLPKPEPQPEPPAKKVFHPVVVDAKTGEQLVPKLKPESEPPKLTPPPLPLEELAKAVAAKATVSSSKPESKSTKTKRKTTRS